MLLMDKVLKDIKKIIEDNIDSNSDSQDTIKENNPESNDNIGKLTYKLNCTCVQMWHNQEFLYAVRKMTPDKFIETYGSDMVELHKMIKRCCDLNNQRSMLMDAIDKKATEMANGHIR